jgi:hypothetical protein
MRVDVKGNPIGYFCTQHRADRDLAIPPDCVVRRVAVNLNLLFSGVSWDRSVAHAEVVDRLDRVLGRELAVVNLRTVVSAVGRRAAYACPGVAEGWGEDT